jgi:ParB-like chromosome segregation protein Spo0J
VTASRPFPNQEGPHAVPIDIETQIRQLEIVPRRVDELIPYARNARTHDEAQVAKIAASIREFGFNNPVLLDGAKGLVAGHGRLLAAYKLGLAIVPTIDLHHLTDAQRRAYILADNRIAEDAKWDKEMLAMELGDLALEDGLDLSLTGFEEAEVEKLLDDTSGPAADGGGDILDDVDPTGRFWIAAEGPIANQPEALKALKILASLPEVKVTSNVLS